jgi:hypothetical protein
MTTGDNRLTKYVCATRSERSKKGDVSHLATAVVSSRDVIQ